MHYFLQMQKCSLSFGACHMYRTSVQRQKAKVFKVVALASVWGMAGDVTFLGKCRKSRCVLCQHACRRYSCTQCGPNCSPAETQAGGLYKRNGGSRARFNGNGICEHDRRRAQCKCVRIKFCLVLVCGLTVVVLVCTGSAVAAASASTGAGGQSASALVSNSAWCSCVV